MSGASGGDGEGPEDRLRVIADRLAGQAKTWWQDAASRSAGAVERVRQQLRDRNETAGAGASWLTALDDLLRPSPGVDLGDSVLRTISSRFWARLFTGCEAYTLAVREDALAYLSLDQRGAVRFDQISRCAVTAGVVWDALEISDRQTGEVLRVRGLRKQDAEAIQHVVDAHAELEALQEADAVFQAMVEDDAYVTRRMLEDWSRATDRFQPLLDTLASRRGYPLLADDFHRLVRRLNDRRQEGERLVGERNEAYETDLLRRLEGFFDTVERYPLTERQRLAIVREENNALVVAGAGTGKTSTVVGKVGFLLRHHQVDSERMLLLAYARKAKEEMEERIKSRFGVAVPVHTFHSLGLQVVADVDGVKPSVSKLAEDGTRHRAITRYIDQLLASEEHQEAVVTFLAYYRYPVKEETEFEDRGAYLRHLKDHGLVTFKGEPVKGWGELIIANWLTLHGIRYEYEKPYEFSTGTTEFRQYQPDFYLPDHGIYIEHLGVDANWGTAPSVDAKEYRAGVEWKRQLHRRHGTHLIETFHYELTEGRLQRCLGERLRDAGVRPRRISNEERDKIIKEGGYVRAVAGLLGTFLSLFKGNQWTVEGLKRAASERSDSYRVQSFLAVFALVFEKYEAELKAAGEIDFDDMIARATEFVEAGRWKSPYQQLVIDEFQDISRGRARLLHALAEQHRHRKVFAVGDDWQSVYRFAGSDVGIMASFSEIFGFTTRTDLDRTFRYNDKILDLSTRFILRNPGQLRKELVAHTTASGAQAEIVAWSGDQEGLVDVLAGLQAHDDREERPTVLLIGRYRHTLPKNLKVLQREVPRLRLKTVTAHSSKGLEADYAVLLDVTSGRYGFPSEIADDPILELVLPPSASFPHAEERRLFYVALTRARNRVVLMTRQGAVSTFVRELGEDAFAGLVDGWIPAVAPLRCDECGSAELVQHESRYGTFWRCANRPYCDRKWNPCSRCQSHPVIKHDSVYRCANRECRAVSRSCPRCGGCLKEKTSRTGNTFLGCTNWRPEGRGCSFAQTLVDPVPEK